MLADQGGPAELHGVDVASIAASGSSQMSAVQGFANELFTSAASHLSKSRIFQYQRQRSAKQPWRSLRKITRHSLKELYGNVADLTHLKAGVKRSVVPSLKPQVRLEWFSLRSLHTSKKCKQREDRAGSGLQRQ